MQARADAPDVHGVLACPRCGCLFNSSDQRKRGVIRVLVNSSSAQSSATIRGAGREERAG
eukprot:scaffold62421_cov69-Phaeocystis_antarctica.AAC.4